MRGTSDDSPTVLPLDKIFEILVSPRRRAVLYELHGRTESIPLADLAVAVSVTEADAATGERTPDDAPLDTAAYREKIAVTLDHVHLPKLQEIGLLDYDRTEKSVHPGRIPRQFERYLQFAAEDDSQSRTIDATV